MLQKSSSRSTGSASINGSLRGAARMSVAMQRRLDALIDKTKRQPLTATEQNQLDKLLEEVDRKSFWMLARAVAENAGTATPNNTKRKRSVGAGK